MIRSTYSNSNSNDHFTNYSIAINYEHKRVYGMNTYLEISVWPCTNKTFVLFLHYSFSILLLVLLFYLLSNDCDIFLSLYINYFTLKI